MTLLARPSSTRVRESTEFIVTGRDDYHRALMALWNVGIREFPVTAIDEGYILWIPVDRIEEAFLTLSE